MDLNNTQRELKDSSKTNFIAKIYRINKGQNSQPSYLATIKEQEVNKLEINLNDILLLRVSNQIFPTVIRRLISNKNNSMLVFTVPIKELKGNRPFFYLNAVSLGYSTAQKSADFLNLSIVATRHYLAKLKKEGYLKVKINKENKYKQLIYSLSGEGKRRLKFYQKVMEYGNETGNNLSSRSC